MMFFNRSADNYNKHLFSPVVWFAVPTFFFFLIERAMSFAFPVMIEGVVHSNLILGIVMAVCSLMSLICDFCLPQVMKENNWRLQLILASVGIIFFPLLAFTGKVFDSFFVLLIASFFWAFAYEIMTFSQQNFIANEEEKEHYSRAWGLIYVVVQLVAIVGVMVGPELLAVNPSTMMILLFFIQSLGLISAMLLTSKRTKKEGLNVVAGKNRIDLGEEFKYWRLFLGRFSPVIIMGFWFGVLDAVFWTYGGLLGINLIKGGNVSEALPLLFYIGPSLIGSLILSKMPITKHKKKYSQFSLLIAGVVLSLMLVGDNSSFLVLISILTFGFIVSFAKPLNDATYSDLLDRTDDRFDQHLLGLAKSNDTFSYLVGPIIAGFLIDKSSYLTVFGGMGLVTVAVAVFLLLTTPRKLRVPQKELTSFVRLVDGNNNS